MQLFHECALDMRWKIANEARRAELAMIISYPTSASGVIVLLKTPTKYREFFPTLFAKKKKKIFSLFLILTRRVQLPYLESMVVLKIIPRARMGSESIAHGAEGPMGY